MSHLVRSSIAAWPLEPTLACLSDGCRPCPVSEQAHLLRESAVTLLHRQDMHLMLAPVSPDTCMPSSDSSAANACLAYILVRRRYDRIAFPVDGLSFALLLPQESNVGQSSTLALLTANEQPHCSTMPSA